MDLSEPPPQPEQVTIVLSRDAFPLIDSFW